MLLALNSNDIGAVSGAVVAALAAGALFGRGIRRTLDDRNEQKREELQIKQAVVGTPPTQFNPKGTPGLIEQMATLTRLVNQTAATLDEHIKSGAR